ncbi:phage integrase SAM-like domain-containing protein, partial [Sphingobacterium daejeonense]|uniref:phage integrase SAM-like domain-containing protein n=1 Tax=Sphingobacterium daejeonense TaxID=371142 RepID=UPI003D319C4E
MCIRNESYTTQGYIKRFLKEKYRRTDIAILELNYSFISDFEHYLRTYLSLIHISSPRDRLI